MANNNTEIDKLCFESSKARKKRRSRMAGLCLGPAGLWVFTGCVLVLLASFVSYGWIESRGGAGPLFLEEVVDSECPDPAIRKRGGSSGFNQGGVSDLGRDGNRDVDGRLDGRVDGRLNGRLNGRVDGRLNGRLNGRLDGRLNGRLNGRLDGRLNGRLNGRVDGERREKVVRLAGSGSNLPLTNRLAAEYMRHYPGRVVVVHQSIGSGGGVRAVKDGRINLALISRPLLSKEKNSSLKVFPYARVAVVPAANPTVMVDEVALSDLNEIYSGRKRRWSNGAQIIVIQRERGDSSHLAVSSVLKGFDEANEVARRKGLFREVFTDAAMRNNLLYTQGAVGLYDYGAIVSGGLPLKVLSIGGVTPEDLSGENTEDAGEDADSARQHFWREDYPFWKDFAFVGFGRPGRWAQLFMEFVYSPAGKRVIEENGYVPLYGGGEGAAQEEDNGY